MIFESVTVKDFRQYYGKVHLDLTPEGSRNIILVGGRNGYGKTNFLLSIVWCLYGDKISQVDDNFKQEIQKEKNYAAFMKQSLNWESSRKGANSFSVEIRINGVEMPSIKGVDDALDEIIIKREFEVASMSEKLSITNPTNGKELFSDSDDRVTFINDQIIPLDAAKFVFFDAEKIASIANLSTKEEGSFINDALGKILGLDVYQTLIEDLEQYANNLKKEGATKHLQEQIIDSEKGVELAKNQIEQITEESAEKQKEIDAYKQQIREIDKYLSDYSKQGAQVFDRESILEKIRSLETIKSQLETKFNELSEIIPLTMLTGQLEEVQEHLNYQVRVRQSNDTDSETQERLDDFIEKLFNQPPEPSSSTISFKDKLFYYDKAKNLAASVFNNSEALEEPSFEHDLNNLEKSLIQNALTVVNTQSKDLIQTTIDQYQKTKHELQENANTLKKVDADLEDELVLEYVSKKETLERKLSENHEQIGINKGLVDKLSQDIIRLTRKYQDLLLKVEISRKNANKISKSNEYLTVLRSFVAQQKEHSKSTLERNILAEMQKLMHKLDSGGQNFVTNVEVAILAEGNGMKVTLLNQFGEEIKKEVLSQGEKQLYISSLIKAIINESVQSLPIFIDTPLGRLDDEHIKNILIHYYPDLSQQVVVLSTNNEITPRRFKHIKDYVSRSYLLVNTGSKTSVTNGYFQGYED